MKRRMRCFVCGRNLYSEFGKHCRLCGMPSKKEFCCDSCKNKFISITSSRLTEERIR